MYPSSPEYQSAIRSASRPYDTVCGTITFTAINHTPLEVDGSNMPSDSISISSQCIDDDALMFGGVFASVLKLSVIPPSELDRYAFYNAVIDLDYKIQIGVDANDDPIFETIPLGIFTVADADKPSDKVILTAYDNMLLLDIPLGGLQLDGTPWQVFEQVQQQTGMILGFEESDLQDFVNYDYVVSASSDRGFQNYRDVVKMICQQLGCFAYANRDGELALKEFSTRADTSLTMSNWYSLVPSDYKCKYIGISITSLKGTYSKMIDDPTESGLTMVIEDAPAWDFGLELALQAKTDNLFNYLRTIDEYTPCEIEMPSDPCFECGDRLQITPKGSAEPIETLVTSIEWKFHKGMSITSEGLNPYLEGGSALDSATSRIIAQTVAKSRLQFVSFTNANEIIVGDNESKKIGECVFNPSADTQAMFVATVICEVDDTDGIQLVDINDNPVTLSGKCDVTLFYKLGVNQEMHYVPSDADPYYAIEELEDGRHIITVSYPLNALEENTRYEFQLWLSSSGGTVTIPEYTVEATIFGQEITDISRFDGTIRVEEDFPLLSFGYVDFDFAFGNFDIIDNTSVGQPKPTDRDNLIFLTDGHDYDSEDYPYGLIAPQCADYFNLPVIGGTAVRDSVEDESGNEILDEQGETIYAEQDRITQAVSLVDLTEGVFINTVLDDSYGAFVQGTDGFGKESMYCGEDMDTGFYNTLYNDSTEGEE